MNKKLAFLISAAAVAGIYIFTQKKSGSGSLYLIDEYKGSDRLLFANKVKNIADRLGINPNWLMAVMHFESKLNPKAVNPISKATGLIQFLPSTAVAYGTTVTELKNMTALRQLDFVESYLTGKPTMKSFLDVYLAVFYPVAINWSDTKQFPSNVVAQNPVFVKNGKITRATIKNVLNSRYSFSSSPLLGKISNSKIINQTEWFQPYDELPFPDRGKLNKLIRDAKGKTGVYLIKENNKVVYVGYSASDLYKTLTRHFQKWNDKQYRVTYDVWKENYKVKILYTKKNKVRNLECDMYHKYKPRDNFNSPCSLFDDVPF